MGPRDFAVAREWVTPLARVAGRSGHSRPVVLCAIAIALFFGLLVLVTRWSGKRLRLACAKALALHVERRFERIDEWRAVYAMGATRPVSGKCGGNLHPQGGLPFRGASGFLGDKAALEKDLGEELLRRENADDPDPENRNELQDITCTEGRQERVFECSVTAIEGEGMEVGERRSIALSVTVSEDGNSYAAKTGSRSVHHRATLTRPTRRLVGAGRFATDSPGAG